MPDIFVSPHKSKIQPPKTELKKEAYPKLVVKPEERIEKILTLEQKTTNPLAAFVAQPEKIHFETQEKKEKIILLLRRHWLSNLSWLATAVILLLVSLLLPYFPLVDLLPPGYFLIIRLAWYLLVFAFTFEKFLTWFFDVNIISDERIIDISFPSILYKDISETKIDQIQDVSVKVGGFARSLFNFGDVVIQTAGTQQEIFFGAVPNPEQVSRVLNELMLEEEQEKLVGRAR